MSIGVSTASLYPMPTEQALLTLAKLGIKTIEIFFNAHTELLPEFLRKLQEIQKQFMLSITAVHPYTSAFEPYLLFSDYKRRFVDAAEYYKNYYAAANALNAKIVVLHGGFKNTKIDDLTYAERLDILIRQAGQQGVTLAHENVNLYKAADPSFILKLKKLLGERIRFVFDIKQAVRAGYDPDQVLHAMGSQLIHLHLSDHTPQESCLLPGDGKYDFAAFFKRLDKLEFTGNGIVEVYRSAFNRAQELTRSVAFLKSQK